MINDGNGNEEFDGMEAFAVKLDEIRSEMMFTSYCNIGAACTKTELIPVTGETGETINELKVHYSAEKHQKLFDLFTKSFEEIMENYALKDEANDLINKTETGEAELDSE